MKVLAWGYRAIVLLGLLLFWPGVVPAAELHDLWSALLAEHVRNGRVDYIGFQRDKGRLDRYLARLGMTDPDVLPEPEQMAFYINLYNASTVQLILDNFRNGRPVSSIKDIGTFFSSPWSIRFIVVGGKTLTLDNIEHDILRPRFRDSRVHFAINCAAKSCPPLRGEAYVGRTLDYQLNDSTAAFLNDPEMTYVRGGALYVSKIFDWFSEDFGGDIIAFVARYGRGELAAAIAAGGDSLKVKYLPYDWSLNIWQGEAR